MCFKRLRGKRKIREHFGRFRPDTLKDIFDCAMECIKKYPEEDQKNDFIDCFKSCIQDKLTAGDLEKITEDDPGHIHAGGSFP
jgi:hypothetical protein